MYFHRPSVIAARIEKKPKPECDPCLRSCTGPQSWPSNQRGQARVLRPRRWRATWAKAPLPQRCMRWLAEDMKDALETGVTDPSGNCYRICFIGVKGDWPYLQKNGKLQRTFNNVLKIPTEKGQTSGLCYYCDAGSPNIPFEQFGVLNPIWATTESATLPWKPTDPPELIQLLPHDALHPEQFFHMDLWHIVHLGVGRTFSASVIVLCSELFPAPSIPKKFELLTENYLQYCRSAKRAPYLTKITQEKVNWKKTTDMPTASWNKGHLTTNILLWLEAFLEERSSSLTTNGLLDRSLTATRHLNRAIRVLYKCDAFIEKDVAQYISFDLREFLSQYRHLAMDSFAAGRRLYAIVPKLHALDHFAVRLHQQSERANIAENPLLAGCQQDEDFIGKPSRLSRRVNIRCVASRTISRYLISAKSAWVKAGMLADHP